MTVLKTERLILRPARMEDAHSMHAILSDPVAMRYWSSVPHETLEQTEAWLEAMVTRGERDFIVEHDGRVIGKAGAYKLPEVGYILAPGCWGRGLAREALAAVVAHIFATTGLSALTADVDPRNAASIRLLERTGFIETHRAARTWHVGGEYCDSVYFALERPAVSPGSA